jgi:hypothetical protein
MYFTLFFTINEGFYTMCDPTITHQLYCVYVLNVALWMVGYSRNMLPTVWLHFNTERLIKTSRSKYLKKLQSPIKVCVLCLVTW